MTAPNAITPYDQLAQHQRELSALGNAAGILSWDRETMMPKGAADGRAEQLATLSAVMHRMATDSKVGDLIANAANQNGLNEWQRRNVALIKRSFEKQQALPESLVTRISRAESESLLKWEAAKEANDWTVWLPAFTELLAASRDANTIIGEKFGLTPYDAALDGFEMGNRLATIQPMFAELEAFLRDLLPKAMEHQAKARVDGDLSGNYPADKQKELCLQVMQALGFDANRGRLDVSVHPFCGGADGDVRITTRYRTDEFAPALFGLVHETGHALYELSRPAEYAFQPVGGALGMMVHESQSLLMEMQVGQSIEFLTWVTPLITAVFPALAGRISPALVRQELCAVNPSLIRVDADEVTYPLHIILRTEIESQLMNGTMAAKDARDAWMSGMQRLLGVTPPDDKKGILQDVHWPSAALGYFPCYTQGAILAAQLFQAALQAHPSIRSEIGQGKFTTLTTWLRDNIHSQGSLYEASQLIQRATGQPLSLEPYKSHLRARYLGE